MTFSEHLYDLLKDKEVGWEAAKAFGDVVDSDTILTKDNHANVKVMRLFVTNSITDRDHPRSSTPRSMSVLFFPNLLIWRGLVTVRMLLSILSFVIDRGCRYY